MQCLWSKILESQNEQLEDKKTKKTVLPNFFCCHGCHGSIVFVWGFAVKHPASPVSLWFVRVGTS